MAEIPWDIPRLNLVRDAVARSPHVKEASLLNLATAPDGTFTAVLDDGTHVRIDITVTRRPDDPLLPRGPVKG